MKALDHLARFIKATSDEEHHEVGVYAVENAADLAKAFGVTQATFTSGIAKVEDDAELAGRLLDEIKRLKRTRRDLRAADRARAAQESADLIGSVATWEGDRVHLDLVSLLASSLTRTHEALVFVSDAFKVAIPMKLLHALARLSAWISRPTWVSRGCTSGGGPEG